MLQQTRYIMEDGSVGYYVEVSRVNESRFQRLPIIRSS